MEWIETADGYGGTGYLPVDPRIGRAVAGARGPGGGPSGKRGGFGTASRG